MTAEGDNSVLMQKVFCFHFSLPDSDADGSLCSADGHGGDADPARQQLVGNRQEPGEQRISLS